MVGLLTSFHMVLSCQVILQRLEDLPNIMAPKTKSKKNVDKIKASLAKNKKAKKVKFDHHDSEEVSFHDYRYRCLNLKSTV